LVRRDINQGISSSVSSLMLKVVPFYYNNGSYKDLLCLYGTVACPYKGNRYNIPIEIWLQQDHPNVPPMAYVKPTPDMYVSTSSKDVKPDGTVIIPYLKNWRHVKYSFVYLFRNFILFILAK
jgi:ESCRT-I complex subunit TSG101